MRVLLLAVLYTVMLSLLSCSKDKDSTSGEEASAYSASYQDNVFSVAQGASFTSSSLHHDFPASVQFAIKDVKNASNKSVSAFFNIYKVGTWEQPLNKAVDVTEAAVLDKYLYTDKVGISIDAATGVVSIEAKATQAVAAGTYYLDLEATVNNEKVVLEKVATISLYDAATTPVHAIWKYNTESTSTTASTTVTKLSGAYLSEVAASIPNYNSSKTYVRLKIADARNKGIDVLQDVEWQSGFSLSSMNPWVTPVAMDDAILLSSPIDRFPVLKADSLLKGNVQAASLANNTALSFEVALNITGEGVYEVVVEMDNHATQPALWWPGGKTVYTPNELKSNNFLSNDSRWSYERMDWSDNFVIFWEKGFGSDPSVAGTKKVDIKTLLTNLEHFYAYYYDTMKFVQAGHTKADQYRTMVMLYEQDDWLATGAGYDSQAGAVWVNYSAANSNPTMAHEVAHTFQYLNNCDGKYAFTGNYNYIGQIWEQSAQYQATLLYPGAYFSYLPGFIQNTHLNLLHEDNRYNNFYHLQYWHLLHGVAFVGQLWQQAVAGEDAVEAYQRITGIDQAGFNDEIYDYARRTLTWDFLFKSNYTNYILSTSASYTQNTQVNAIDNGYYIIEASKCVQNYGFNALQLDVPAAGTIVKADFEGLKAQSGYNNTYDQYAGWRWGFVAITSAGNAVYSNRSSDNGEASFTIPDNTSRLYFLVTGAPTQHFHHSWDDDPANDEQYPWKAKFEHTQPKPD